MGTDMRTKIGVKIKRTKKPNGEEAFTASVPMKIIFGQSFDANTLERKLKLLEQEYQDLIVSMREIIGQIKSKNVMNNVILYWILGDKICSYEKVNSERQLTVIGVIKHLARDLGVSKNLIRRCRRFRVLYPKKAMIDQHRTWTSYLKIFEKGYKSANRAS